VVFGYLMAQNLPHAGTAAQALERNFERIRVGLNTGVEVVLGGGWDGPVNPGQRIDQVMTSTFAGGGYSGAAKIEGPLEDLCRTVLRAAYLGTLLAAERAVVLTLIGGGVFGNPHPLIFASLLWALEQRDAAGAGPLEVVLNARALDPSLPLARVAEAVAARGGVVVQVEGGALRRL
jgi:hypothetical protein